MKLSELINIAGLGDIAGENDPELTGVYSDSRQAKPGSLFVAVKGTLVDGHDYIGKAIEQGAVAIVCEQGAALIRDHAAGEDPASGTGDKDIVILTVPDSAEALGRIASAWYGEPSARMTVVGVTGTNGKTTIATLLYNLFRKLGYKAGLLSTICNYIDDKVVPTEHTTPDPLTINQLMSKMADAGCEYVFMEVSSHSIDQKRISGVRFNGGIFTNLTRDHLDYHKTVDHYLKAKKKFFDNLPASAFALTNADDKTGLVMLQNTAARKLTYSLRTIADFKGKIMESHFEGMEIEINGRDVYTHFTGRFNASNILAVYGAAVALGEEPEDILVALSTLHPVAGRFETIRSPKGFTAIVDYAHTPDALANVLNGINEVLDGRGRVITVVGAGGDRDKGKRPLMAKEAVRQSDQLILTSDNPRFEEPDDIINDMEAGLNASDKERTLCITDRKQAIKTAFALAKKGDVVLIAGKGHEDYQEVKGVKHHFDDRETVREMFNTEN
ncbi:MAG: UDP-N-acetylmuramoyl-L-alanyl-D-glutamate--2,6-diaminopimelate ligase [Tannerella sp.]|jgi:UDP-N-acetylmuramoyl-L-alanyl-D-glutamate--2,6-diaminopimelate ligase|nr:UDP-N-acetylmuramoyl-L-alanyl-D-glutamate--2,6-diaminopimelate ligase [Tannerella sp.]